MKSFFNFLSEARVSKAAEKAKKLGLTSDGSGGWRDRQGVVKARTVSGELVFSQQKGSSPEETSAAKPVAQPERQPTQSAVNQSTKPEKSSEAEGEVEKENKRITLVFGRFNPPTIGHEKLLTAAKSLAKGGEFRVYPSRTNDPKKNPLDPAEKVKMMHDYFPDMKDNIINDEGVRTIFDALKIADSEGFQNVQIVVGSDRVSEFDSLAQKYNGDTYEFETIDTISAGDRDPDAEGVEGMSASKMREAAANDDFEAYRAGVPASVDDKTAKVMMNTLRKRMQVKEGWSLWEIAPKFDWKNLRENYVNGNIFNVNSLVENLNTGLIGKVIRRGTNYLICVTEDNIMFKSWIRDLKESEGHVEETPKYDIKGFINKNRKK